VSLGLAERLWLGEADDDFGGATDGYLYGDRLGLLDCVLLGEAKDGVDRGVQLGSCEALCLLGSMAIQLATCLGFCLVIYNGCF
jgi:hypothetical protein